MKRTVNVDKEYKGNAAKAIDKFFKAHPELDYWKDQFEWMAETGADFFCDNLFADGTYNADWRYALHLDQYDGTVTYIAIIERA